MQLNQQVYLVRLIQVRSAKKMNPVMGGSGCQGIMTTQAAKPKLPEVQLPLIPHRRLNSVRSNYMKIAIKWVTEKVIPL